MFNSCLLPPQVPIGQNGGGRSDSLSSMHGLHTRKLVNEGGHMSHEEDLHEFALVQLEMYGLLDKNQHF